MKTQLLAMILGCTFTLTSFASEVISFNVKGLWTRGRIPESKIAYVEDVNALLGSDYTIEDIRMDLAQNGCVSPFVQLSVKAMLHVFGPSRKIVIRQIEAIRLETFDLSESPCTYVWRGGQTGRVCNGDVCVSASEN